jgi:glycosyltransferase involved in cell wall biosynthesis
MRVAILAAGTAGTYCGSCLRDNRLAATLRAQGRDVLLLPLYTPLLTEERDVSERQVLFGGINIYLQQTSRFFRWLPPAWDAAMNSRAALRVIGRGVGIRPEQLGALTVSVLNGAHGRQRKELDRLVDSLAALAPRVVSLPTLLLAGLATHLRKALSVPIVCEIGGEELFVDRLTEPFRGQAYALIRQHAAEIDACMAPSRDYAQRATQLFGLPRDRVHHVPLGIVAETFATTGAPAARAPGEPLILGLLARVSPEKGARELCESFVRLRSSGRDCRLHLAGELLPQDRAFFQGLRRTVTRAGVAEHFEYRGRVSLPEKVRFLQELDLFVAPTPHPEAKGLYVLEALAAGVPVVLPRRGSFPELVEAVGGGLLYDPDEPGALDAAVIRLMEDVSLRRALSAAGSAAARAKFGHHGMAERAWQVFELVRRGG